MGLDFDQLYPGKFLKAGLFLGKDVILTIKKIELKELGTEEEKETKVIASFAETPKQLVLNKTNGSCIKEMFGRNTDQWIGKRVTFFPAKVDYGDTDLAIRVRGSPDLKEVREFTAQIGLKKKSFKLIPTGAAGPKKNGNGKAAPKKEELLVRDLAPGEDIDPLTGEVIPAGAGVFPGEDAQL